MTKQSTANLGFEKKLWAAADKLRSNMDPTEYKHVVLGLIFVKYISDSFEDTYQSIKVDKDAFDGEWEDKDAYKAKNVFWVSEKARSKELEKKIRRYRKEDILKLINKNDG